MNFVHSGHGTGDWEFKDTWKRFAIYCALHGCRHVVVSGDCGLSVKMCKRLVVAGILREAAPRARVLYSDNDIVIGDLQHEAFAPLCGSKMFSIGCRFEDNSTQTDLQHQTNSGVMCIQKGVGGSHPEADPNARWTDILSDVARCYGTRRVTDQYVFHRVYEAMYQQKVLHCFSEDKYATDKSSEWARGGRRLPSPLSASLLTPCTR